MLISVSSELLVAMQMPHFMFWAEISSHAWPTHFVMRNFLSLAEILLLTLMYKFSCRWLFAMVSIAALKGSLNTTSTGWTKRVVPAGTKTGSVLQLFYKNIWISSAFGALLTPSYHHGKQASIADISRTSCQFHHTMNSLETRHSIVCHTFSWRDGQIRLLLFSPAISIPFSQKDIHLPFPLKIKRDFTLSSPSANKVIWIVHCLLSRQKHHLTPTLSYLQYQRMFPHLWSRMQWGLINISNLL